MKKGIKLKGSRRDEKKSEPRRRTGARNVSLRHLFRDSLSVTDQKQRVNEDTTERKRKPAVEIGISVDKRKTDLERFHAGESDRKKPDQPEIRRFAHPTGKNQADDDDGQTDRQTDQMRLIKHSARLVTPSRRKKHHKSPLRRAEGNPDPRI